MLHFMAYMAQPDKVKFMSYLALVTNEFNTPAIEGDRKIFLGREFLIMKRHVVYVLMGVTGYA